MNKPVDIYSLFQPTFGNRPLQYIGRNDVIEQFMAGLREPIGSRNRCTLFLGQRGMGKEGPAIQPYRKRLIEAGIIEAPRRGELVFAVPYLSDYLSEQ
jgi:hypothetical protein